MKRWFGLLMFVAVLTDAGAQDLRATLFANADAALEAATAANARLLAPRAFEQGAVAYTGAENDLERGRSVERITQQLADAQSHFQNAVELARIASVTLAAAIETRGDAMNANAATFAAEQWSDGEALFETAARRLEAGTIDTARERAAQAEAVYSAAELTAIKAQLLSQTRAVIAQAEQARVPRYAPRTFARAASLLTEAEQALDRDRYDTEPPRGLAEQASYEARHAIYLASRIQAVDDSGSSVEDLMLEYETVLLRIADSADVAAELDSGTDVLTDGLVNYIESAQARESTLLAESEENRLQISGLQEEIRELDERLGGVSQERVALVQRLEADEAARGQFARVESMFERGDALVYREGNNIILRLVGLSFEVGESTIDPSYRALIQKVRDAANVFPRSLIIVEGHTDSMGSDAANLALSRARAEAVGRFLTDELGVQSYRVRAMGFGETRPIANNETQQGRAGNRRIDVRIEPPRN